MTQAEWDAMVLALGDVWQKFRMDEAAGLPQDSGDYGGINMTAGTGSVYQANGPFDGALAIKVATAFTSPVTNPPALNPNYAHPKTILGWIRLDAAPAVNRLTTLAAGTIGVVVNTDLTLQIARWANPNQFSSKTPPLQLGTWHLINASSEADNAVTLGMRLFIDGELGAEILDPGLPWPVPNNTLLRCGLGGEFLEVGTALAYYSNIALIDNGALTPDVAPFPIVPQVYKVGTIF